MSQETPVSQPEAEYEETWREIEDMVQHLARLSRQAIPSDRFFSELVDGSVRTLAATAGAVWLKTGSTLRLEYQSNFAATGLVAEPGSEPDDETESRGLVHGGVLEAIIQEAEPRAIAPQSGSGPDSAPASAASSIDNPTESLLLLCPIIVDDDVTGVLEIFQRANVSPAACSGYLQFLNSLASFASDFVRNQRLRDLQEDASLWVQFETFSDRVHQGLDPRTTAAVIANDGRPLIGCDRLSVAVPHGSTWRIIAVSGVDTVDRRSPTVRTGQELIRRVARTSTTFWHVDTERDGEAIPAGRAPQIEDPLNRFLDESLARLCGVVPLTPVEPDADSNGKDRRRGRSKPVAVLLVESFEAVDDVTLLQKRCNVVARQSQTALSNAVEHAGVPLLPALQLLGWGLDQFGLRRLPRTTLVLGALVAAVLALVFVPADFSVDGRGELQPAVWRGVYASTNGQVSKLSPRLFDDAPFVEAGDMLAELTSSELDFEMTRVTGELSTAQESLTTKGIERLNLDRTDPRVQDKLEAIAAQEKELETEIASLEAQQQVLQRWKQDLVLTSPIDGQVLTFDPVPQLQNRPVRQGERLLEVAAVQGEWELRIRVKDENIGFVRDARRELKPNLDVSFIVATHPEVTYTGRVRKIARDTRPHDEDGPTVLVTVAIDRKSIPTEHLRPGATVVPRIECGRRSIGFVWFHELIHAVRTRILF